MLGFLSIEALNLFANLLYKLIVLIEPYISELTQHHFFSSNRQQLPIASDYEAYTRFINEIMSGSSGDRDEAENAAPRITTV